MGLIKVTVRTPPKGLPVRQWREATREGHLAMGRYWTAHFSALHFRPMAAYRYQYRPRSRKYLQRKRRLAASGAVEGSAPLVFRGDLRAAAALNLLRGFPTRVRIERQVPKYAGINYKPGRPNLAEEQFKVNDAEVVKLTLVLDKKIDAVLRRQSGADASRAK